MERIFAKRVAVAFLITVVMVLAMPLASADSHPAVKAEKGPEASEVTWEYVPLTYGVWTGHVVNSGLKWLVVEVFDNTTGVPEEIMRERIRFKACDAFPTGTVNTTSVIMSPYHRYLVSVTPNGPGGNSAVVTDVFEPMIPPVASFTWTTDYLVVSVDGTGSYDPDGTVVAWTWDWGDGSTGCGVTTSHTYETSGTFNIMLLVTDESELSNTTSEEVSVVAAAAEFSPPHSDHGFDADGDGLYDSLVVDLSVTVSTAGYYDISAWLYYGSFNWIALTGNYTYLDSGLQTVEMLFGGYKIHSSGIDGPYYALFKLFDWTFNLLDDDTHTTHAYTWDQFQAPPAELAPPHSDQGLDADGDGLYDFLVVDVSVTVATAGFYSLNANLYDPSWNLVAWGSNHTYLDSSMQTLRILFEGPMIYGSGLDGPYTASLDLADSMGNGLDSEYYNTQAYTWNQFQIQPSFMTAVPITKGPADNTGGPVQSLAYDDGWIYEVAAQRTMAIDSWDVGALAYDIVLSSATLFVTYSVDPAYQGTDPILWARGGSSMASTGIVPNAGDGSVAGAAFDLFAAGVTTLWDVKNLNIMFTNTGTDWPGAVQIDRMWIVMSLY